MSRFLILCQSEVTSRALNAWRALLCCETLDAPAGTSPLTTIVFDPNSCPQEGGTVAYEMLVERLEAAAELNRGSSGSNEVVVIVDSVLPMDMCVLSESGTWDHLIAMLVLTFPEIRWVFGVIQGVVKDGGDRFELEDHDLVSLLAKPRRDSLLDPTGLREWVKSRTNAKLSPKARTDAHNEFRIPRRLWRAAAIDEEQEYAFMHGYTAFRYGFRADIVISWSLMDALFGKSLALRGHHGYFLLLEDMRLRFPDKPSRMHLSRLPRRDVLSGENGRAHHCPLLEDSKDISQYRFLITTGQMGKDQGIVREAEEYLERKLFGRGSVIYKPVGGIVDLWEKAGLTAELGGGTRSGNAPAFIWPPTFQEENPLSGHGTPSKLALVAYTLLQRAGELRERAYSVKDFIRGAVLAVEATELLGGKTPTLTQAGLALKQEFEVRAECVFVGAGYHFALERRLKELEAEVEAITRWFHENSREKSAWNAKAGVLNRLALVFRGAGQLEEEQRCLVDFRKLNRKMSRPNTLNPLLWTIHGTLAYGEWLMASFPRILLLTSVWLALLTGVASSIGDFGGVVDATSGVVSWFFGGSAQSTRGNAHLTQSLLGVLSWFGVVAGVFHIGILISYLYSLIARK